MWWDTITGFQQGMFILAVSMSSIMVILLLLAMISLGSHADFDDVDASDFDSSGAVESVDIANDEPVSFISGFKLVNFRSIVTFLAIGGWAAFALSDVLPWWAALLIAIVAGAGFALLTAFVYRQIYKLEQNGNVEYKYAIGKQASVYIKIPGNGQTGKIIVQFNDRYLEVDAVTTENKDLIPGAFVKIVSLRENNVLVVESIKEGE